MANSVTVHTGLSENSIGAISYLTLVPALLFLAIAPYNRSAYVRFHAWQSVVVCAIALVANFVLSSLNQFTSLVGLRIYLILCGLIVVSYGLTVVVCLVGSLNGKRVMLPLVGAWAVWQANR